MYGLGSARVDELPGLLGNLLVAPDEVVAALPDIAAVAAAGGSGLLAVTSDL